MIEVRNLRKEYDGKPVVEDVSFLVRPGQPTGYLGPNGAGKSTTVKMLAGLAKPTAGSASICGFDLAEEPLEAKRRVGYVPESSALYASLTPNEYLSLVAELHQLPHADARDRIGQLLHAFEILATANRQIETLSKGQRQKVLLASALIHDPEVLLLDEPLTGLDVNAALTFRRMLQGLAERGNTILFCSHILEVVERTCERIVVLHEGKVVADDTTENLLGRTTEGTLESVFQALTRADHVDEWARSFLDALDASGAQS